MQEFLDAEGTAWARTLEHAQTAERAIRTMKRGLDARLENLGEDKWDHWWNYLPDVPYKYNSAEKSSAQSPR